LKILLVNPPAENTIVEYTTGDRYKVKKRIDSNVQVDDHGLYPPLGLLYVASYLEKYTLEQDIHFLDCIGEKKSYKALSDLIKNIQPDVVGITSFTISLIDVCKTAILVRKSVPKAHICLGGHHSIAFPYQAAQLEEIDSIVVGEGEIAFTELIKAKDNGDDITQIRGVYTAESIKDYYNPSFSDNRFLPGVNVVPAYIDNLDELPIPNRSYIQHIKYFNPVGLNDNLATIITSRGCPFHCTFCDMPYKRFRKRSIKNVIDEVKDCLSRGYNEIHFYDDLFAISASRVIEFCNAVETHGLKFNWDFRARVDTITKESLIHAKKAGCWCVGFGVETGTDDGLKKIKKGINTSQIKDTFGWCRELGLLTIADFMIGFPFEKTEDDIKKNIKFLIDLDPDYALISILMLLPNTEIYNEAIKKGIVNPQRWIDFSLNPHTDFNIDYWTENISRENLVKLHRKAYRLFYTRPRRFLKIILSIRSFYELKRKLQGFLALWK